MVACGEALGRALEAGVVYLQGGLGAGKTTLCRGILRAKGHGGAVKSPTYTLVEPYALTAGVLYHFDLYRLGSADELEFIGIRDYFDGASSCLIEWPERGEGKLPQPDLRIIIELSGEGGRTVRLVAETAVGDKVLERLGLGGNG